MELLVGCGNSIAKRITSDEHGIPKEWTTLWTLDADPNVERAGTPTHVVHDLNIYPYPFDDDQFDEVHAYQVLEHCGSQGDWRFFFRQFHEFWRILKPDGLFVASVPMWDSPWAWGDPGHTRVIPPESLAFLDQEQYGQVGETSMTDYRSEWKGDFQPLVKQESEHELAFVLRARK